jgi:hypothetical protein
MTKVFTAILCMAGFFLAMSPLQSQAGTATLNPRCVADYCPTCPQPLGASRLDKDCRRCLKLNLKRIMRCSKSAGSSSLSPAIIGLWQSSQGISMLVVQTTNGFRGHLHRAPQQASQHYTKSNMVIMNASASEKPGNYQGTMLTPGGNWQSARFVVRGSRMTSYLGGGGQINWSKQGR